MNGILRLPVMCRIQYSTKKQNKPVSQDMISMQCSYCKPGINIHVVVTTTIITDITNEIKYRNTICVGIIMVTSYPIMFCLWKGYTSLTELTLTFCDNPCVACKVCVLHYYPIKFFVHCCVAFMFEIFCVCFLCLLHVRRTNLWKHPFFISLLLNSL